MLVSNSFFSVMMEGARVLMGFDSICPTGLGWIPTGQRGLGSNLF